MAEFQTGQGKDPKQPDPEGLQRFVTIKREPPDLLEEKARRPLCGLNDFLHNGSLFFENSLDGIDGFAGGFANAFNSALGGFANAFNGVLGGTDSGAELAGQFRG